MKRLFTIFISAALLASCFSCAKKETASQSVGADVQNTVKAEMPFKDISSDDIGEVFFALTRGGINYECTKSYTEADAINKTVDFLNNATVSSKNKYENNNVGNNPPYVVEFKDGNGDVLYSISFTDKFKEGYYCYFKNTSSDKQKEFFVDGEYLYPLIEHIASLEGGTLKWEYSRPFESVLNRDDISKVEIEYGGKTTQYTDRESITKYTQQFRYLACTELKEKWNDELSKICVVSFYGKNGASAYKFETNGHTVGDNVQLKVNDNTFYLVNKAQFDTFLEDLANSNS